MWRGQQLIQDLNRMVCVRPQSMDAIYRGKDMDSKALIITLWLGNLPAYFKLWLHGIRHNPTINWLLVTDATIKHNLPPNLKVLHTDAAGIASLISDRCDIRIPSDFKPYKMCDFKPMFADMFKDYLVGYAFWAWGDMDVLYGNLRPILQDAMHFDVIGTGCCNRCSGPLCFFRNVTLLNSLYKKLDAAVFQDREIRITDENLMTELVQGTSFAIDLSNKEADPPAIYKNGALYDDGGKICRKALLHFGGGGGVGRDFLRNENLVPSLQHVDLNKALRIDKTLRVSNTEQKQVKFITCGCDSFAKSKDRLEWEVYKTGMFDKFHAYSPADATQIARANGASETLRVMNMKRGAGYWIWKPIVIQNALEEIEYGDILVYADAGCSVVNEPDLIRRTFEAISKDGVGVSHCGTCGTDRTRVNRMDVLLHFISRDEIEDYFKVNGGLEFEANRIIIYKRPESVAFIDKWASTALHNPTFFTDMQSSVQNHPNFWEHRHDQSIYNCIAYNAGVRGNTCDFSGWLRATRFRV